MNLAEIKNATREELIDYLEMCGEDAEYRLVGLTRLRDAAREMYWKGRDNDGFSFESVVEGIY
tara:strand:+ start:3770 stop:3958 length:189 start_codon:yes stop_codon:yes gene_type:complete